MHPWSERTLEDEITALFGISVGALNAAYLTSHIHLQPGETARVKHMLEAARSMEKFWLDNVTGPKSLVRVRNPVEIGQSVFNTSTAFSGWRGLVDHSPLLKVYDDATDWEVIKTMTFPIEIGFTDYSTGQYNTYDLVKAGSEDMSTKIVFASAVTPITMDYVQMTYGDDKHVARMTDGGLRHIVPSEEVVQMCDDMVAAGESPENIKVTVVACHPRIVPNWIVGQKDARTDAKWRPGLAHIVERAFRFMEQSVVDAGMYFLKTELGKRGVNMRGVRKVRMNTSRTASLTSRRSTCRT